MNPLPPSSAVPPPQSDATSRRPRLSAAVVLQRSEGGWLFGVVGKRTYHIERGRCRLAPAQPALVEEPETHSARMSCPVWRMIRPSW